eukprot:CAMPEP_0117508788 /NCGR_PEP_ID=MMETSP0784-20121206/27131_1 /TAXON_ID=39447 /ORGANISM="" /LENGTH=111 /DNA_ID=CAMNT_0005304357 /DNA_START=348 /DNA_END=684 /DNA_ORIENTATION=+
MTGQLFFPGDLLAAIATWGINVRDPAAEGGFDAPSYVPLPSASSLPCVALSMVHEEIWFRTQFVSKWASLNNAALDEGRDHIPKKEMSMQPAYVQVSDEFSLGTGVPCISI